MESLLILLEKRTPKLLFFLFRTTQKCLLFKFIHEAIAIKIDQELCLLLIIASNALSGNSMPSQSMLLLLQIKQCVEMPSLFGQYRNMGPFTSLRALLQKTNYLIKL